MQCLNYLDTHLHLIIGGERARVPVRVRYQRVYKGAPLQKIIPLGGQRINLISIEALIEKTDRCIVIDPAILSKRQQKAVSLDCEAQHVDRLNRCV